METNEHKITQIRFLTDNTFVIRFDRKDLQFKAGQYVIVGLKGEVNQREYSIYSGEKDNYLEILVREILGGIVSMKLKKCKVGGLLQISGPFGSFGLNPPSMFTNKLLFIATGTGISPFHSFIKSYPKIDYILFHGVSYIKEAYDRNNYGLNYHVFTSKEAPKERVSTFLKESWIDPTLLFYLCGNNNMTHEVYHILKDKGIPDENIFSEVFF